MSFSQKQNIIFYVALTLSAFQLIQYLMSGGGFLNSTRRASTILVVVDSKKAARRCRNWGL